MLARSGELALLALVLGACSVPPTPCRPKTVMTTSIDLRRPVVTAPEPITLVAPALSCLPGNAAEVFSAVLTLSPAPAVPLRVAFTPQVPPAFSTVAVDLTGLAPGRYRAQLFLEPAIAATTFDLTIVDDRRGASPAITSTRCEGRRSWTSWGALVCEHDAGVTLALGDGGVELLAGASEAMVSGAVVWTTQTDGGVWIERRVGARGGGFEFTHASPATGRTPSRLASNELHLWRGREFFSVTADGGLTLRFSPELNSRVDYRLVDDDRPIELRVADEVCDLLAPPPCRTEPARRQGLIAGLGREALWLTQNAITGDLPGLKRPLAGDAGTISGPGSSLLLADFSLGDPARVTGARPLVFRGADAGGRLFVERDDGLFELWREPEGGRLVFASELVLVFDLPDGGAEAYTR